MNDEISDEEHKQTKAILRRYRRTRAVVCCVLPIAYMSFIILCAKVMETKWSRHTIWIFIFLNSFGTGLLLQSATRRFARKLSLEEGKLLVGVVLKDSMSQYTSVQEILKEIVIDPEKEFLRPAEKTDDNTLLRAATQPDDIPQEQLLRPTQHDTV